LRFVRFTSGGRPRYGMIDGDYVWALSASPFSSRRQGGLMYQLDGREHRLDEVKLLAPCTPSKII